MGLVLLGADNQPQGLVVGEIVPNPVDEDEKLVFDAQNLEEVHEQPDQPRESAPKLKPGQANHRPFPANRSHGSKVFD